MKYKLSKTHIEQFAELGFVAPVAALSPTEAGELNHWVECFERHHRDDLWAFNLKSNLLFESIDGLCRDARFLDPVEDLLGPDILLSTATFRIKQPASAAYYGWHQDDRFIQVDPHWVLVFLAVTPCTIENGCLQVVPGSHLEPMMDAEIDSDERNNSLTRQPSIKNIDASKAVSLELAAGEIGLFHSHIVHGSGPNRSGARRTGLIIDYMPAAGRQNAGHGSATLVRGEDRFGHFAPEPAPKGELSEENIIARRRVLTDYPENVYFGELREGMMPTFPDRFGMK